MKQLHIIVAGTAGSGKSAIIRVIRNALLEAGMKSEIHVAEGVEQADEHQGERLAGLAKGTEVTIVERPLYETFTREYQIRGFDRPIVMLNSPANISKFTFIPRVANDR